jgi:zinc-ribbon domain
VTCPKCQTAIPDESAFCLRCGARLAAPATVPRNGGVVGSAHKPVALPRPVAARAATEALAAPPATPGGKQAWTLSFKPLADERLRYRVARWICEQAPAHALAEVQAALLEGQFATFLALTADEAEKARQRLQGLGVHQALWRLAPATTAELLVTERARPAGSSKPRTTGQKIMVVAIGLVVLFVFGALAAKKFQATVEAPTRIEERTSR